MLGADSVAVDDFAVGLGVDCMQVEAGFAGDEGDGFFGVRTQHGRGGGWSGVVAGGHDAAARDAGVMDFKAADVIALPAMQGNRRASQGVKRGVSVYAQGFVLTAGSIIVTVDLFRGETWHHGKFPSLLGLWWLGCFQGTGAFIARRAWQRCQTGRQKPGRERCQSTSCGRLAAARAERRHWQRKPGVVPG